MKKLIALTIAAAAVLLMPSFASAQVTATGTLTVSATVTSSIQLVFNSHAGGVVLGGTGTNAATLAFGNVSAFGAAPAGVTVTPAANSFTVSSPVDVFVTKANSASANYALTAQLSVADAVNTWQVGGVTVTAASAAPISATANYAVNNNFPVAITIPFATATGTVISNTIKYTATSN